jgi:hypothetical protein
MNHSGLDLDLRNRKPRPVVYNLDPNYTVDRPQRPSAAIEDGAKERRRHKFIVCGLIAGGLGFIAAQFIPSALWVGVITGAAFFVCLESVEVR